MFVWEYSSEFTFLNQSLTINCHIFLTSGSWNKNLKRKTKQILIISIAKPMAFGGLKSLGETKVIFTDVLA